jgi:hypothetical protein
MLFRMALSQAGAYQTARAPRKLVPRREAPRRYARARPAHALRLALLAGALVLLATASASARRLVIAPNRLSGNDPDVPDAGSNNCWRHNQYSTGSVPDC